MKTLFFAFATTLTLSGCGLVNGLFDGVDCDENDVCTCQYPIPGDEDAICSGESCQCLEGDLNCADASADCEVRFNDGECFNATCGCEAADGTDGCDCAEAGTCVSRRPGNTVDGSLFGCVGVCSCSSIGGAFGELCACGVDGEGGPSSCLLDVEDEPCSEDDDCEAMARAEAIGCDPNLGGADGCVGGAVCDVASEANAGVCVLKEDGPCPPGHEPFDGGALGNLCSRVIARSPPRCQNGRCSSLP